VSTPLTPRLKSPLSPSDNIYLQQARAEVEEGGGTIVHVARYGSHLYGLATPNSDYDYVVVYVPGLKGILSQARKRARNIGSNQASRRKNGAGDVDVRIVDVASLVISYARSAEMTAIDTLFAPTNSDATIYLHPAYWGWLVANVYWPPTAWVQPESYSAMVGYIRHQLSRYQLNGTRAKALGDLRQALSELVADGRGNLKIRQVYGQLPIDGHYVSLETAGSTGDPPVTALAVAGKKMPVGSTVRRLNDMVNRLSTWIDSAGNDIDYKAVSHAVRAWMELRMLRSQEPRRLSFPFNDAEAAELVRLKQGGYSIDDVRNRLEGILEELNREPAWDGAGSVASALSALELLYRDVWRCGK